MFVFLKKRIKYQDGFTLVELMIVISIIGVLAAIAVPKYSNATAIAYGGKIQSDLMALDTAIQMAVTQGYKVVDGEELSSNTIINANINHFPTPGCSNFRVGIIDYNVVDDVTAYRITMEGNVPRASVSATASNNVDGPFTVENLGK